MNSRQDIIDGGDTGPAIVAGDPDESLMIDAINYGEVYEMPPDTKMTDEEIGVLTKWVEMGAPWPKEKTGPAKKVEVFDLAKRKADHWCWQPAKKTSPPSTKSDWAEGAIDKFILAKLESANLQPAQKADRRTLIRRVYFDLIGLPPTPTEIEAFLNDESPNAFANVVDELLASKHFGEHWARKWMDLTRYAETCGHEFDYPIPDAWKYRDYLIRAFNAGVPYDQFIREHLAGDLMHNPRLHPDKKYNESILGTGFWFLGEATHGPVDVKGDEAGRIDNQIDVMSKTFLGLTVACARCHDHKFDAISTEDYYSLAGFLQSSRRQRVMLDLDQKIKSSYERATELVKKGDQAAQKFISVLPRFEPPIAAKYFQSAISVLRTDPTWSKPVGTVVQGESLKNLGATSGIVEVQEIKPQRNFKWQGNKQIWWRDGKVDDVWAIEFDVQQSSFNQMFEVKVNLTTAGDYGAARISVNEKIARNNFDCYSKDLRTTGAISLGNHQLQKGKNKIEFVITGHHENAIPRHMIGVDYVELVPLSVKPDVEPCTAERAAAEHGLEIDNLNQIIAAIKSPALNRKTHPLNILQSVSNGNHDIGKVLSATRKLPTAKTELRKNEVLFEDFEAVDPQTGLPEGWFRTGYAYNAQPVNKVSFTNSPSALLEGPGAVHSGIAGGKFFGVLRSPTFELTHNKIHYRIRGANAQIRLIIDGFEMDIYNALLFNSMRINVNQPGEFGWLEQAGDIRNYLGHRAHIEIIDHSDGAVSIDEIRFSNDSRPKDQPSEFAKRLAESTEEQKFASDLADSISQLFVNPLDNNSLDVANWMLQNHLDFLFESETSDVSTSALPNCGDPIESSRERFSRLSDSLLDVQKQLIENSNKTPVPVFAVGMTDGTSEDEFVFIRGNHKTLGTLARRNFLTALSNPMKIERGSGRMQLVDRIVDPANPLASRVAVNRIWHHLLGVGIVPSVDNFGVLGQAPTHPELLDYLATEFVKDKWAVKRMIKRIVLTKTYQMSSTPNPDAVETDPDNRLLHRARIKRLSGESIRDAMLSVSGELDDRIFGPPVAIHLTPFMQGRGRPGRSGPLDGDGRRSIYISVRRNFLSPMMLAFDTPIPFNTTGRRNISNVPAQALIMMNDPFVVQQAEKWAKSLIDSKADRESRIRRIYEQAFGRVPTKQERAMAIEFLEKQSASLNVESADIDNDIRIWRDFCHVIFNVKQFIYIN